MFFKYSSFKIYIHQELLTTMVPINPDAMTDSETNFDS